MTAKEFLENIRDTVPLINAYQNQLLQIRIIAYGAPTPGYREVVSNTSRVNNSPQELYIIKIENCEEKIKDITVKYADNIIRAVDLIEMLEKIKYRSALMLYYISNLSEKNCAAEIGISLRQFQNRKVEALREFETVYLKHFSFENLKNQNVS